MKATGLNSRRFFIKKSFWGTFTLLAGGATLIGCGGGKGDPADTYQKPDNASGTGTGGAKAAVRENDPCDINALSEEDLKKRKSLGYIEKSEIREKRCKTCQLFIPSSEAKACGGCALFTGPVEENGYCFYWAPQNG